MIRSAFDKLVDIYLMMNGNESSYSIYNNLLKMEKMEKKDVDQILAHKLKTILTHAEKEVTYYKKTFSQYSFESSSFSNVSQLEKIPILTKNIIRSNFPSKIKASSFENRAIYNTTSGSTGEPLEFYNDTRQNSYRRSSFMYFNHLMGVNPIDIHWNLKSVGNFTRKQSFNNWLLGKYLYSVVDVNIENLNQIVHQIKTINAKYIEGYTASLVRLAVLLQNSDFPLDFNIKAIIATSETLSEPGRNILETVFNAPVFNRYGSREMSGAVSQECSQHDGFHVNPLLTFVEIVDENGENVSEGESGNILITDLNNEVMPFIRYDIGDIGTKGGDDCPCGLPFNLIKSIQGRKGEFIIDKNGQQIPFITISAYLFRRNYAPYVTTYQFNQEKPGKLILKIVPNEKLSDYIYEQIVATLNQQLPDFENEVILVDEIPPQLNGKTPFLQSSF